MGIAPQSSYDVVISDGRVIDGTGNAWFYGDVGVTKDRISWVGPAGSLAKTKAGQRIDARGMVASPGYIDIQSGSYATFLVGDGRSLSKVTQGVTTEIMGEAYTLAP
ncbi:MAG: D-aminoacylase, partial [Gemmatimonadales bacterium]